MTKDVRVIVDKEVRRSYHPPRAPEMLIELQKYKYPDKSGHLFLSVQRESEPARIERYLINRQVNGYR